MALTPGSLRSPPPLPILGEGAIAAKSAGGSKEKLAEFQSAQADFVAA